MPDTTSAGEIDRLVKGLNPRVRVPKGLGLWSRKLQVIWLRQNQKPVRKPKCR